MSGVVLLCSTAVAGLLRLGLLLDRLRLWLLLYRCGGRLSWLLFLLLLRRLDLDTHFDLKRRGSRLVLLCRGSGRSIIAG